jgi:hypothetical protein
MNRLPASPDRAFGLKISCRLFQVGAQQECGHAGATLAAREFKGVVRDADNCFSLPSLTANRRRRKRLRNERGGKSHVDQKPRRSALPRKKYIRYEARFPSFSETILRAGRGARPGQWSGGTFGRAGRSTKPRERRFTHAALTHAGKVPRCVRDFRRFRSFQQALLIAPGQQ